MSLDIIIQALLDKQSKENIIGEINQIRQALNQSPLKLKLDIDSQAMSGHMHGVEQQVDATQKKIKKIFAQPIQINTELKGLNKDELEQTIRSVRQGVQEITKIDVKTNAKGNIKSALIEYRDETGKLVQETMKWQSYLDKASNTVKRVFKTTDFKFVNDIAKARREVESSLTKQQSGNFDKAKSELQQINNLQKIKIKLTNDDTELANVINQQLTKHKDNYEQILQAKIQIDKTTSAESLNEEQLLKLSQLRKKNEEDIARIQATQKDAKARTVSTTTSGKGQIGEEVAVNFPVKYDANAEELKKYAEAVAGVGAEYGRVIPKVDSLGNKFREVHVRIMEGGNKWHNYIANIDEATGKIYKVDRGLSDVTHRQLSTLEKFKTAMQVYPIWLAATTVVMSTIHTISSGIQYIHQFDDAVVDLTKVVDLSAKQIDEMKESAIQLGKELGKSSVEIMQGMAEFGRITKEPEAIKELTRVATMASNVTEMTAEQSAKAITTAMVTFGVEAKDAMKILDSWNEIQNNFRVSATSMAEAISKVGAASKVAKTDMSSLEGIISSIIQSTGIEGNEAGTAVKSFISRIYRTDESDPEELGKTAKALKEILDIDVSKPNGELKSFGELIGTIAGKWKGLSEQQQMTVAQQIGSTYHYSKFIALMQNYNIAMDATSKAMNSQGSAAIENAKYVDSITGRLEKLGTTWEDFTNSVVSSDVFKVLIGSLTVFLNGLNTTPGKISLVVGSITLLTMAVITFRTQITAAGIAVKGFFTSLGPIGWITLAVSALVPAVLGVAGAFDQAGQKSKEALQQLTQSIQKLKQETSESSSLISQYESLSSQVLHTAESKQQLADVTQKLSSLYGEAIIGYDSEGKAILANVEVLKQLNQEKQNELNLKQQQLSDQFRTTGDSSFSQLQNDQEKLNNLLEQRKSVLEQINNIRSGKTEAISVNGDGSIIDNLDQANSQLDGLNKRIGELQPKVQQQRTDLLNMADAFVQAGDSASKLDKGTLSQFIYSLSQSKDKISDFYDKLDALGKSDFSAKIGDAKKQFDDLAKTNPGQAQEEYTKTIAPALIKSMSDIGINGTAAKEILDKVFVLPGADQAKNKVQSVATSISDLIKESKKADDEIETYNNLLQKKAKGEAISGKEMADALEKYPALIDAIKVHNGVIEIDAAALQNLTQQRINDRNANYQSEIDKLNATKTATLDRISIIKAEIASLSLLARARMASAQNDTSEANAEKALMVRERALGNSLGVAQSDIAGIDAQIARIQKAMGVVNASNFGVKSSSSGSSEKPSYEDPTDAIVRSINAQAELTKQTNETLKTQIDQAKKQGDINTATQKTIQLLQGQKAETDQLKSANSQLLNIFNQLGHHEWVDQNGEATTAYYNAFNSGSKNAQESIKKEFDYLSKIKKAVVDNTKAIEDSYNVWFETANGIANEVVDAFKKAYEQQKQAALDSLDAQSKALDEKLSKEEKVISALEKQIDLEASKEDYAKKLSKAQKEQQDIQNKINAVSLDTSIEGKARKAELQKQLQDKIDEITEMQTQHDRDARKQNLQDQLQKAKDETDVKKTELEKQKTDTEYYYDELINNETKYAKIREDIIKGNVANIKTELQKFVDEFSKMNADSAKSIGESYQKVLALITEINNAKNAVNGVTAPPSSSPKSSTPPPSGGSSSSGNNNSSSGSGRAKVVGVKSDSWLNVRETANANATAIGKVFPGETVEVDQQNGDWWHIVYNTSKGKKSGWANSKYLQKFHTGGIVGGVVTSPIQELVNKMFNTSPSETVVKSLLGELQIPPQNIMKNFVPNMQNLINSISLTKTPAVAGQGNVTISMPIHIENLNGDQQGIDKFFSAIDNGMLRRGIRLGN